LFASQSSIFALVNTYETAAIQLLNNTSVSIRKTKYITIDGTDHKIGEPKNLSFENSDDSRAALTENMEEPLLSAILTVWEDSVQNDLVVAQEFSKTQIVNAEGIAQLDTTSESASETPAINEVTSITLPNDKFVAFSKNQYVTVGGIDYKIGDTFAVSYENSERGREFLAEDVPEPFYSAVMMVWGDTPTIVFPPEIGSEETISE